MPEQQQIFAGSIESAPKDYVVGSNVELVLRAVNAEFTDNGAASDWLPAVVLLSDSGHVIARAVDQGVKITAGDDAAVSWFPGVKHAAASTPGTGGFAAWGGIEMDVNLTIPPFPDPGFEPTIDWTGASFREDGSGTFSWSAATPTQIRINTADVGWFYFTGFGHASTNASVVDPAAVDLFIDPGTTAFDPAGLGGVARPGTTLRSPVNGVGGLASAGVDYTSWNIGRSTGGISTGVTLQVANWGAANLRVRKAFLFIGFAAQA